VVNFELSSFFVSGTLSTSAPLYVHQFKVFEK
jgi:hypothetical protein